MFVFKVILSYVIGAFPTGYLVSKYFRKTDIRKEGSGNIGATNVWRVAGKLPGIFVLLVDIFKGYWVVEFFSLWKGPALSSALFQERLILGLAVILGHTFCLFLKFRGGKGVATSAGVIFALSPGIFFLCLVAWAVVFAIFRYVSLASIAAVVLLPVFLSILAAPFSFILFTVALALLVSFKHLPNIRRLINREESKFRL